MAIDAPVAEPPKRDVPWPEARRRALQAGIDRADARPPVTARLLQARDRVLAADVSSRVDLPPFDTAAMDGWATRGAGPWRLVGETAAGKPPTTVQPGEAIRISTGAVVPPGCGVLRSEHGAEEDVQEGGENGFGPDAVVAVAPGHDAPSVGTDTRMAGEEVRSGEVVLTAGTTMTPPAIGLAAAAGIDSLSVHPLPVVDVFVLGDELVDAGVPGPGQVRDALAPQLPGWIAAMHATLSTVRRIEDSLRSTLLAIERAEGDVLITTGGTARGPADHVRAAVERLGGEWVVDGVAVRPGHPMKLAALPDGRLWIALPGNPLAAVSALVTLGEPSLAALAGREAPRDLRSRVPLRRPLAVAVEVSPGAHRLIPAAIDGGVAHPVLRRGPAMLSGLASADVFVVVPPGPAPLDAGDEVEVLPLPWGTGLVV